MEFPFCLKLAGTAPNHFGLSTVMAISGIYTMT